jgi:hypothetical protein
MFTVHHQEYFKTVYTKWVVVMLVLLASASIVHLIRFHYKNIFQKFPLLPFRQGAKPSVSAPADWATPFTHMPVYLQCNSVSASSQLITNTNTQMLPSLPSRPLSTYQTHK